MPQPIPFEDTIPAARDVDYPGVMTLKVDATDTARAIYRVEQTIPVPQAGRMTLMMPAWLPGNHAPRGQIEKLAGLVFRAGGRVLPWVRDEVNVYAFHIDVPEGVRSVTANFEFLSATAPDQGRVVIAPSMMNLQWEQVSLYPAGYFTRRIPVQATVTYPAGWTARSGLPATNKGNVYSYQRTSYETLIDSPVFAGRYFKEWKLSDRVDLNAFADEAKYLEAKPEQIAAHAPAGRAGGQAVRRAALRPVRVPAVTDRRDGRDRAGASPFERERREPGIFHRLGFGPRPPQPVAA